MSAKHHFLHFFTPRPSNNHKARALHLPFLGLYVAALIVFQIGLIFFAKVNPGVLGYASNISVNDLLANTNAQREKAGLPPLTLNSQLSQAAQAKGEDMFAHQYWAHVSPSGTDPWFFINQQNYRYLFAGENLARDFADSPAVVSAWMQSPTHKENLLNSRYKDVGFAVVNGKYGDYETTIVVQMFGATSAQAPTVATAPEASAEVTVPTTVPPVIAVEPATEDVAPVEAVPPISDGSILGETPILSANPSSVKIDVASLTKTISLIFAAVIVALLLVDAVMVYRRKIVRVSGHNVAHLLIFAAVLVALNLLHQGMIL